MGIALIPVQGIASSVQITNKADVPMDVGMKSLDRNQFIVLGIPNQRGIRPLVPGGLRLMTARSASFDAAPGSYRIFATTPDRRQISQKVAILNGQTNEFAISVVPRGTPGDMGRRTYAIVRIDEIEGESLLERQARHRREIGIDDDQDSTGEPASFDAGNLGITYEQIQYDNGTFGARLTKEPMPGSPAAQLQLEPGDTVFELDGMRFRQHQDVLSHTAWTKIRFVSVRTNCVQGARVYIP